MEDFTFDIGGILTEEEAENLFKETPEEPQEESSPGIDKTDNHTEEEEPQSPEKVGEEENIETGTDAVKPKDDGSSPKFYSSIASALKNDGIFPDFSDEEIDAVNSPEDFGELFEKAVQAKVDEVTRRVNQALNNGVQPDQVRAYEQTIQYLGGITDDALKAEGEEGENLRKQLIYNDLVNKGYSKDRIAREIEKSFQSGSDVEDAKDALDALNSFYKSGYQKLLDEAQAAADNQKKLQQQNSEKFRKMVLDDEIEFGSSKLDNRTKQQIFDAVSKPVWKDPDTGQLLTKVQKFQKENPLEFLKQLGMWFVLTDGGKSPDKLVKEQVRVEKNKGIRELERKINSSALGSDGSLRYLSGNQLDSENLLEDGWKIDLGQ